MLPLDWRWSPHPLSLPTLLRISIKQKEATLLPSEVIYWQIGKSCFSLIPRLLHESLGTRLELLNSISYKCSYDHELKWVGWGKGRDLCWMKVTFVSLVSSILDSLSWSWTPISSLLTRYTAAFSVWCNTIMKVVLLLWLQGLVEMGSCPCSTYVHRQRRSV